MLEMAPQALPNCFENWCQEYDEVFGREAQREHFRSYLAGLLGEVQRKNVAQIAASSIGVSYTNLHHFIHNSPWDAQELNNKRLEVLYRTRQSRLKQGVTLILDDCGHRKSGEATDGVGRQYIGEIGKVDNGIVVVTSHATDGVRCIPLDFAQYKHATSLPEGKKDPEFIKKPELALQLIDRCLERGTEPGVTVLDTAYGNNGPFLKELERRKLTYVGGLPSNRVICTKLPGDHGSTKHSLEEVARALKPEAFQAIELSLEKPRTVWVATVRIHMPKLEGQRTVAIQLNAPKLEEATEIDYYITNAPQEQATPAWIAQTYSQRNWIEVFYREAKGWLGMSEYEVRDARGIERHWTLVFNAYSFITWLRLTGGLKQFSLKPLTTFGETWRAFWHLVECKMLKWLETNVSAFAAHRAAKGLIFA
jgi:SRSO17 transposase